MYKGYWDLIKKYTLSSIGDFSTWSIIIANIFVIYDFFSGSLMPEEIFFIYLVQSMIIFLFFGIMILCQRSFTGADNKSYSGKGLRTALLILAGFFYVFYGIAHYMLLMPFLRIKLNASILIAIGLFFASYLLFFIKRFKIERERLERLSMVKGFFEPAVIILPIYLGIIMSVIFGGTGALIGLIILKIWADIISNSPINSDEPFVYALLKMHKERKMQKIA
jgi:hypothetical protein